MGKVPPASLLLLALGLLGGCGGGSHPAPLPAVASAAFVYVSNTAANTLTGIDVTGGNAKQLATALPNPGGTGPLGLAATGKLLYIANSDSATVSGFTFDADTGALDALPGSPYTAAAGVNQLALCPGNGKSTPPQFLYAAAKSGVLGYSISSTGRLTRVPGSPFTAGMQPSAVVTDSSCHLVFVANQASNNISAFSVNSSTGFLTAVAGSPFDAGSAPAALAIGDGFLFAANSGSNNISAFNIKTGVGTGALLNPVAGSPFAAGSAPSALVYFNLTLYAANVASNNVSAFSVAPTTGNFTAVTGSPFSAGTEPEAMIAFVAPAGDVTAAKAFLYVANASSGDVSGFTIEPSGVLSVVQGFPFPAGSNPRALVFACGHCGYP